MIPLSDEVTTTYNRLHGPDRVCEKCDERPADGETLKPLILRLPQGSVVFATCDRCAANDAEQCKARMLSRDAAAVFEAAQSPEDLRALADELERMQRWIKAYSADGQRCDECSVSLSDGEYRVATADVPWGKLLYVVCSSCCLLKTHPNIVAQRNHFLARFISNRAAIFIPGLIDLKKVTVN